jgi:class 3 adenylate cyclase/predicted ATPase
VDTRILLDYVPVDRWQALLRGESLPTTTSGAVLFADISGFTPLTEGLSRSLGPTRGAEELSRQLNQVYDALIAEVDRYRGAVISFSGDAITCWFDDRDGGAPARAVQCALLMQERMQAFSSIALPDGTTTALAMKAAVASGPARRFVVGDPDVQRIDTLAGNTVVRVAQAEHLAEKGDVVVDDATVQNLGDRLIVRETREDHDTHERFGVVSGLNTPVAPLPWPEVDISRVDETTIRPWLLPPIYERLKAGVGEFLTELRPGVIFFLRFEGIDYENDPQAGEKLDTFVRQVQVALRRYDGWLLQLTIGDKGSYLYGVFGTIVAHEDDDWRAASTMLALRRLSIESDIVRPVQIGISHGTLRAGAYGGSTRRTYGALGDEVNLAARLMQAAVPGEVLASLRVYLATSKAFQWETLAPVRVKGKSEPVRVFRLMDGEAEGTLYMLEPVYALPMIGRAEELQIMLSHFEEAKAGRGQLVTITGAAGMGKSRLVAEFVRLTRARGMIGAGGACQSYGKGTSYLVWTGILRGLLGIRPTDTPEERLEKLRAELTRLDASLLPRLPLLGIALNIDIADNDYTATLEPQLRKSALEALILEIIRLRAQEVARTGSALALVLEDAHWLDESSRDLVQLLAQSLDRWNLYLIIAQRPNDVNTLPGISVQPVELTLKEFTPQETQQLIAAKLEQFDQSDHMIAPALLAQITQRAGGNPFFVEELLNYLNDRGLILAENALQDLPPSLQTLILSRIDQLTERQRITLKVASIIGRQFYLGQLYGYYPTLGELNQLQSDLAYMDDVEITLLDEPEPEIVYLFKHVMTYEVTYESLPYATRTQLHEQYAAFLEMGNQEKLLDIIAYHYGRSANIPKKRHYFRLAGEAAARRYANDAAVDYFTRALEMTEQSDLPTRYALVKARERVLHAMAQREGQMRDIHTLEQLAEAMNDDARRAEALLRRGVYAKITSNLDEAVSALAQAAARARAASTREAEVEAVMEWGQTLFFKSDFSAAAERLEAGLGMADDYPRQRAYIQRTLAMIALRRGDFAAGREIYERVLPLFQELGDRFGETIVYNDLGNIAFFEGQFRQAREHYERALAIRREIGYRYGVMQILNNLGAVVADENGDFALAIQYLREALLLARQIGDRNNEGMALNNLGFYGLMMGSYAEAQNFFDQALALAANAGHRSEEALFLHNLGMVAAAQGDFATAHRYYDQSLALKRELGDTQGESETLAYLGQLALLEDDPQAALAHAEKAIALASEAGAGMEEARAHYYRAGALLALGQVDGAAAAYETALKQHQDIGQDHLGLEAVAGLAITDWRRGRRDEALSRVNDILAALKTRSVDGLQEAGQVYLICHQILRETDAPRAASVLRQAQAALRDRQSRIINQANRAAYIEQIAAHRALMALA